MRIDDIANQRDLRHVRLGLTDGELAELRDALETLLSDPEPRHEHVASADYERELTFGSLASS